MPSKSYVVMVFLTATPDWLKMSREARGMFIDQTVSPIIGKYADKVHLRWIDTEAFSGRCSDIALFETSDLQDYYFLMEELRDTAFFSQPYFRLEEVLIGLEDGFRAFEQARQA